MLYISIAALQSLLYRLYFIYQSSPNILPLFPFSSFIHPPRPRLCHSAHPPAQSRLRRTGSRCALAYVIPSIGFLLQAKEIIACSHVIIIPLTALALAYFLDPQLCHLFLPTKNINAPHSSAASPGNVPCHCITACLFLPMLFLPSHLSSVSPFSGPPSSHFPSPFCKSCSSVSISIGGKPNWTSPHRHRPRRLWFNHLLSDFDFLAS